MVNTLRRHKKLRGLQNCSRNNLEAPYNLWIVLNYKLLKINYQVKYQSKTLWRVL